MLISGLPHRLAATASCGGFWRCCAAVVLLTAWTDRADATCGDYLHLGGLAVHDTAGQLPAPVAPATPCRGPSCRNGNRPSPLAPTAPVNLSRLSEHLLSSHVEGWHHEMTTERLAVESAAASLPGHLLSIDRPPKRV